MVLPPRMRLPAGLLVLIVSAICSLLFNLLALIPLVFVDISYAINPSSAGSSCAVAVDNLASSLLLRMLIFVFATAFHALVIMIWLSPDQSASARTTNASFPPQRAHLPITALGALFNALLLLLTYSSPLKQCRESVYLSSVSWYVLMYISLANTLLCGASTVALSSMLGGQERKQERLEKVAQAAAQAQQPRGGGSDTTRLLSESDRVLNDAM